MFDSSSSLSVNVKSTTMLSRNDEKRRLDLSMNIG